MESQSTINTERRDKIVTASCINSNYIGLHLFQLLGRRQQVAKMMLEGHVKDETYLECEYDYLDTHIKQLLGI